jgi:hypothetical protein
MRRRFLSCVRRPLSLLFAAWLFALLLEAAPHLVHHLFDEDQGSGCEFLAAADVPAIVGAPPEAVLQLPSRDLSTDVAVPRRPTVCITAAVARAPPRSGLALA